MSDVCHEASTDPTWSTPTGAVWRADPPSPRAPGRGRWRGPLGFALAGPHPQPPPRWGGGVQITLTLSIAGIGIPMPVGNLGR